MRMIWDKKKVTGHHHGLLLNESSFADKKKIAYCWYFTDFQISDLLNSSESSGITRFFKKKPTYFFFLLV